MDRSGFDLGRKARYAEWFITKKQKQKQKNVRPGVKPLKYKMLLAVHFKTLLQYDGPNWMKVCN